MKTELQEQCTICYEILNSPKQITITKEYLNNIRLLVQTIDFTLLQHKPICEVCLAKIKSACKFKTTYLDLQENTIKVKNEEDVYSDKLVFCEICKDIVNSSDTIPLFDPLLEVSKSVIINNLCPELESRINENLQTCESCHKAMLNFCNITNLLSVFNQDLICDENESESVTVKKELQQSDIVSTSEHCSVKIKDEVIPVVQDLKVEKDSIEYDEFIGKNEELHLKMDCEEELEDEGNWTKTEIETRKNFLNLSTISHEDDKDEFKTKDKYTPKSKEPDEIKRFQCELCEYRTIYKYWLKRHITLQHKKHSKNFQCETCEFNTKYKNNLKQHMLIHKKPEEVELYQCQLCEFKTIHKNSLTKHNMLQHKKPDEVEMFQCNICEFKTKYERSLQQHIRIHKKSEDIKMFQCAKCKFKTMHKYNLKIHMLRHKKYDDTEMFRCATCEFKSIQKSNLKTHMLKHNNSGEVDMFQCEVCELKTKYNYELKRHMLIHKKYKEIKDVSM